MGGWYPNDLCGLSLGHGIILGRRQQKISFGFINQDYGTGVIEVVFP